MSKLRILLITTSYGIISSGEEAAGDFVNSFVHDLKKQPNIDVRVIFPSKGDIAASDFESPFSVDFMPLSLLKIRKLSHWKHIFNTLRRGKKAVLLQAQDFKPHHVFALWALPSGYWAMKTAQELNINYSIWCLGSDIWSLSNIPIVKTILKKVLKNAEHVFADGFQLCEDVEALSKNKCEFLPSSRDLNVFDINPLQQKEKFKLCFIGRWHLNKGIDIMLESLKLLTENDWKLIDCVIIAGGGPLESLVRDGVEDLNKLGRHVRLKGFVGKKEATKLIMNSDFMLIPSRIDSIPVIFSDAVQLLRPVISMPVGDMPKIFQKYSCGVLSKAVNPIDYSKAISKAIRKDLKLLNEKLIYTRDDFYVKQNNYLKFINKISNFKHEK